MNTTDPIADMLTRIRNANSAKHESVEVPASNMKKQIAQILVDEGYIKSFNVIDDGKQGMIKINLKYGANKAKVLQGLKKISKPGLRIYVGKDEVPKVMRGLGVAIISTPDGIVVFNHGRSGFFQFLRDSLQMFGDHIAHQNIAAGRSGRNHIGARLDLVGNDGIRCSM